MISDHVLTIQHKLQQLLNEGIGQAALRRHDVVCSLTVPLPAFDSVQVFSRGRKLADTCMFWSSPDGSLQMVGVDSALSVAVNGGGRWQQVSRQWEELRATICRETPKQVPGTGVVLMGGFSFDPHKRVSSGIWREFPDALLVLPKFLFTLFQGEHWMTINVVVNRTDDSAEIMNRVIKIQMAFLNDEGRGEEPSFPVKHFTIDEMGPDRWKRLVSQATEEIRGSRLEKVVLARQIHIQAQETFSISNALRVFRQTQKGCFHFAVSRGRSCFLGATPERLVEVRDDWVRAACLASSIGRGRDIMEDKALGEYLLNDPKSRAEHAFVVRVLKDAFSQACHEVDIPDAPVLMKLKDIQHLYTPVSGRLKTGESILKLVSRLHPTPAVGGFPREAAVALIRDHEQLDRGWYAAPVGWMDEQGSGEFAVALRSGLLREREGWLFAGCGIVADSDPESEFEESCWKLRPMLNALEEVGQ